jgi:hypothetical protein
MNVRYVNVTSNSLVSINQVISRMKKVWNNLRKHKKENEESKVDDSANDHKNLSTQIKQEHPKAKNEVVYPFVHTEPPTSHLNLPSDIICHVTSFLNGNDIINFGSVILSSDVL